MMTPQKGTIFVVAAASGTGKTTLVGRLLAQDPNIKLSVSHTTRPPRTGEVHGQHYFFVEKSHFEASIQEKAFLEYAQVYDNYYGTSFEWINQTLAAGHDVLLEIDVQGAAQVRQLLPEAVGIFILPPSIEILAQRLNGRGTDTAEVIAKRMNNARHEIEQAQHFDYVVINNDLEDATADLVSIVRAQRLTQKKQHDFYLELLK
ncbi:MAG: guanylate kinase [Neisseriaceae bacterium]|nr:guanylate kinase [Neisseriaceae bacterium]MBP6860790.1 guanylate kinase [Neisseriaceae bacterium]